MSFACEKKMMICSSSYSNQKIVLNLYDRDLDKKTEM